MIYVSGFEKIVAYVYINTPTIYTKILEIFEFPIFQIYSHLLHKICYIFLVNF